MQRLVFIAALLIGLIGGTATADVLDAVKQQASDKVKGTAQKGVVDKVNKKLLDEGHKNQCAFKVDSDELAPGCDTKLKKLASALIDGKKALAAGGVSGFKFVVSGHTDSTGDPKHNKDLSQKRAEAIAKEMVARGVPKDEITAVGMGFDQPLVKPDDTAAKKAKNRRYEIQVQI